MSARTPFGGVPLFEPAAGRVILAPEVDAPGYWVGAPSVWVEGEDVYLSVRHRRPLDRGRGWKSVIYHTSDGATLTERWACTAEQFNSESIERCALVHPPEGPWRYYVSYVDPADRRWRIDLLEAPTIEQLDPRTRIPVLDGANTHSEGVKDPVMLLMDGLTYLLAGYGPRAGGAADATSDRLHGSGNVFTTGLLDHPTGMWMSGDGRTFGFERDLISPGTGWDRNVARVSTIMPTDKGFLIFYDGRTGEGDVYEDRTGLASSPDLSQLQRHSDSAPILQGTQGTRCLRYLDYALVGDSLLYFYETSTANDAHELRLSRVKLE